jgi:hypothetical protein
VAGDGVLVVVVDYGTGSIQEDEKQPGLTQMQEQRHLQRRSKMLCRYSICFQSAASKRHFAPGVAGAGAKAQLHEQSLRMLQLRVDGNVGCCNILSAAAAAAAGA